MEEELDSKRMVNSRDLLIKSIDNMFTKIDLIFTGSFKSVALKSLLYFFRDAKNSWFNSPEISTPSKEEDIINVICTNDYIDYVISAEMVEISGTVVSGVFVNLGKDDGNLELLLSFDLKDMQKENYGTAINDLQVWSIQFRDNYGFGNVRCQIDNGGENEFYFINSTLGPLYNKLSH